MTKTLLTKIVIGVLATGTVGTVGLVVASKIPATAETIKSIPVVGQYIDVVTFNQGLSDEEFDLIMNFDEKYYEPKSKELRAKYGIDESVSKITTAVELADIIENNPEASVPPVVTLPENNSPVDNTPGPGIDLDNNENIESTPPSVDEDDIISDSSPDTDGNIDEPLNRSTNSVSRSNTRKHKRRQWNNNKK